MTGPVDLVIIPRAHDLGGFEVRRALPSTERQMVGPFIFFDQMGPGEFLTGSGLDVRPHPHIGLSTVTYLLDGEILHRDSLGSHQAIVPGDVNWMTAAPASPILSAPTPPSASTPIACSACNPGWPSPATPRRPPPPSPITQPPRYLSWKIPA